VSPRFPSSVIDQMLTRGQITRVAGEGAHALLAEAVGSQLASALDLTGFGWMRTTRNATEYGSDRHPSATAADVDEAVEMATTIHQRAGRVLDHMYPY
jgi:hypothetical protein